MYLIASLLFVLGIAAGGAYGFFFKKTATDILFFMVAGGFAGSAAGGLVFTYLYLTNEDENEEAINDGKDVLIPELRKTPDSGINPLPGQPLLTMDIPGTKQKIYKKESDRQKIKRLKKEIKKLKKRNP